MPSSTKKQRNFMAAIAHNPFFAKKVGVPQSVGKDFNEADKGRKFGRGGKINIQNTQHGKLDMPFKQLNRMAGMKGGGSVKKFAKGGSIVTAEQFNASGFDNLQDYLNDKLGKTRRGATAAQNEEIAANALTKRIALRELAVSSKPKIDLFKGQQAKFLPSNPVSRRAVLMPPVVAETPQTIVKNTPVNNEDVPQEEMRKYDAKKGGLMKESKAMMGKEMMFMKKKGAPASMMGMKHGGMAKYAKGGGIESRGKTQGTIIKMATGGSVSSRADGIAQRGKTKFKNY